MDGVNGKVITSSGNAFLQKYTRLVYYCLPQTEIYF